MSYIMWNLGFKILCIWSYFLYGNTFINIWFIFIIIIYFCANLLDVTAGGEREGKHLTSIGLIKVLKCLYSGEQCRSLLRSIKKLNIPEEFTNFKELLLRIKDLHQLSNSQLLLSNHHNVIDEFRAAWLTVSDNFWVSTTPKIHILNDNLKDYFNVTYVTLIKCTDQLTEHMHQFLNIVWMESYYLINNQ